MTRSCLPMNARNPAGETPSVWANDSSAAADWRETTARIRSTMASRKGSLTGCGRGVLRAGEMRKDPVSPAKSVHATLRSARYAPRSTRHYFPSATRFVGVTRIPLAMMRCVHPSMIVARALSVVAKRRES